MLRPSYQQIEHCCLKYQSLKITYELCDVLFGNQKEK